MANYYGSGRTNYFRVKDFEKFIGWLSKFSGIDLWLGAFTDDKNMVGFGIESDDGCLPSEFVTEDEDMEEVPVAVDFLFELSEHLDEGQVAVFMHAGNEKLRYITGYAEAINSKGEREVISLDHIYEIAKKLGEHCTEACY